MVNVKIKKIAPLSPREEEKIIESLSLEAKNRLEGKRNEALHLASLTALSILPPEKRAALRYAESGAPGLKIRGKSISVTHSDAYAAVAVAEGDGAFVGIDAEDAEESKKVPTAFFTEGETRQIESGAEPLAVWTRKEALFKYNCARRADRSSLRAVDSSEKIPEIKIETFRLADGRLILSVCTEKDEKISLYEL